MSRFNDCHEDNKSCLFAYQTSPSTTAALAAAAAAVAAPQRQHVAQN